MFQMFIIEKIVFSVPNHSAFLVIHHILSCEISPRPSMHYLSSSNDIGIFLWSDLGVEHFTNGWNRGLNFQWIILTSKASVDFQEHHRSPCRRKRSGLHLFLHLIIATILVYIVPYSSSTPTPWTTRSTSSRTVCITHIKARTLRSPVVIFHLFIYQQCIVGTSPSQGSSSDRMGSSSVLISQR